MSEWGKPIPDVIAERAHTNVTVDADTGCWISNYSKQGAGYAVLSHKPKGQLSIYLAHRASWTYSRGPIPAGMTVDHTCFTKACVNPDHLRLLSNRDNATRRNGKDHPLGQCSNGHPESFMKLYHWGKVPPQWGCSECLRERNARGTARRKAEREAAKSAA